MQKLTKVSGVVAPLDRVDVDTDQIIPARFLRTTSREGLGKQLFADWRYAADGSPKADFVLNQPQSQGCAILVGGRNFGCGSSREHAPWALQQYGFKAVIAPSFADIFFNNSFKNGFLPIVLTELEVDHLFNEVAANPGYKLTIDLDKQTVTTPAGKSMHFDIDATRRHNLLNGLDEIGLTLQHADEIKAYEEKRKKSEPWIFQ